MTRDDLAWPLFVLGIGIVAIVGMNMEPSRETAIGLILAHQIRDFEGKGRFCGMVTSVSGPQPLSSGWQVYKVMCDGLGPLYEIQVDANGRLSKVRRIAVAEQGLSDFETRPRMVLREAIQV